jgi:hypothetical protein
MRNERYVSLRRTFIIDRWVFARKGNSSRSVQIDGGKNLFQDDGSRCDGFCWRATHPAGGGMTLEMMLGFTWVGLVAWGG